MVPGRYQQAMAPNKLSMISRLIALTPEELLVMLLNYHALGPLETRRPRFGD